ncbi:hypothetical protein CK203_106495 [Vitis vinifera]|uniref:Uncharacterized protein n=1 Tax=Vitis vinifera TaxID=29760 RepID=A0A438CFW9_VITVI|nr:hypothetical protein CK203_106495 [Vitis vinifera]
MYVLRDAAKNTSAKDKSTFSLVPKRDDQLLSDKSVNLAAGGGAEALKEESGVSGAQQNVTSPVKNILGANSPKQNQRREGSGRIIRSILLNKDARQSQSSMFQSGQQSQASNLEKEKRPPRPPQLYTQPAMQRKVRDAAV